MTLQRGGQEARHWTQRHQQPVQSTEQEGVAGIHHAMSKTQEGEPATRNLWLSQVGSLKAPTRVHSERNLPNYCKLPTTGEKSFRLSGPWSAGLGSGSRGQICHFHPIRDAAALRERNRRVQLARHGS